MPITEQALEQIGPAQQGTIRGGSSANDHVVAPASAGVATIEHELFGAQSRLPSVFVQAGGDLHQFIPIVRRMDVDFDYTRVGSHFDVIQPIILRWKIAFDDHGGGQFAGRGFNRGDEMQVILDVAQRRHEDVQASLARFHANCGAYDAFGRGAGGQNGLCSDAACGFAFDCNFATAGRCTACRLLQDALVGSARRAAGETGAVVVELLFEVLTVG